MDISKQQEILEIYRNASEENQAKIFLKVISLYNKQCGIESDFELLMDQDEIEFIRNYRKFKKMCVDKE